MTEQKVTREMVDNMSDSELKQWISQLLDTFDNREVMEEMIDENSLYTDIMKASKRKRKKASIRAVIGSDYDEVFECDENMLLKTIRNVQLLILTESWYPKEHEPIRVHQHKEDKVRYVIKPFFEDEAIIQHAVIRMIMPQLRKGMYKYTCACIPGRGVHYARRAVSKAISDDPKNTKYVLKMDIRKFFDSIPHRILKKKLRKIVKDPVIRELLFRIIDTTEKGLPLGFFTSMWLANYYLQSLDHYIKEKILVDCGCNVKRTGRYGAVYYYRYMDDMVIFGPNKKELHKMRDRIEQVLNEEFGLTMRYDWQVFRLDYIDKKDGKRKGRPLDFVGYKFYHDKVTIRRKTYKRMMRLIKILRKKGITRINFYEAAAMMSYYGLIYWSSSTGLYTKYLRPYVKLKDLKKIIKTELNRRAKEAMDLKKKK